MRRFLTIASAVCVAMSGCAYSPRSVPFSPTEPPPKSSSVTPASASASAPAQTAEESTLKTLSLEFEPAPFRHPMQMELGSTRNWEFIANDVVAQWDSKGDDGNAALARDVGTGQGGHRGAALPRCVYFPKENHELTAFEKTLRQGLIRKLLANTEVYSRAYQGCGQLRIEVSATQLHDISSIGYRAGDFSVLTGGLIALHHLVGRVFSEWHLLRDVAVGESLYWLTPEYVASQGLTEVSVAVSMEDESHRYLRQYSNVYYAKADDAKYYQPNEQSIYEKFCDQPQGCDADRDCPRTSSDDDEGDCSSRPRRRTFAISDEPPIPVFHVTPRRISACASENEFMVVGNRLSPRAEDYVLGGQMAQKVLISASTDTRANGSLNVVTVSFAKLPKTTTDSAVLQASSGADGAPKVQTIAVEACATPTVPTPIVSPLDAQGLPTATVNLCPKPADAKTPLKFAVTKVQVTEIGVAALVVGSQLYSAVSPNDIQPPDKSSGAQTITFKSVAWLSPATFAMSASKPSLNLLFKDGTFLKLDLPASCGAPSAPPAQK